MQSMTPRVFQDRLKWALAIFLLIAVRAQAEPLRIGYKAVSFGGSGADACRRKGQQARRSLRDRIGSQGFESNPTICLAQGGRVWVTGPFTGIATFEGTTLQSTGAEDIFVAELK
jgi:hypothetical protein